MEQLLSIKHVPIKVEVKVQRAELKPVENNTSSAPSVQVSAKQGGGVRVQANPYRVNLSENRNYDSYVPSANSENSFSLTYEAIAKIAENGNVQGADNSQFAAQKSKSIESVLQSLPKGKNNAVSYADGTLSINYQMPENQSVDITADMAGFEFVPGSIEFVVTQMPEIDIEYLGDPIYFPRSADPNYEAPLDVKA
ncbi:MAG: hypothetical protein IJC04_05160 [Oscillospiraceae bacterium]|nr:hypothetical protein [Oscillospiraceae bacterium]